MAIYAFAAFGTNNIGDEAIFNGLSEEYPGAIQMYVNKVPKWGVGTTPAVWYADFLTGVKHFVKEDTLIIGGGGLLHSMQAINDYYTMAQLVFDVGGKVIIEGLGAEGLQTEYKPIVKNLLSLATHISVRTTTSRELLQPLTTKKVDIRSDFAYSMKWKRAQLGPLARAKYLGIVVGGTTNLHEYDELCALIKKYSVGATHFNFLILPHSISYTNPMNNDRLVAQYIWSNCDIYHSYREDRIHILEYLPSCPEEMVSLYSEVMYGVIGWRYHSLIFSELANKPILLAAPTFKNMAYVKDVKRSNLIVKQNNETLEQAFLNLIPLLAVEQF